MEPIQALRLLHILGAAVFIGYGLFALIWQGLLIGKTAHDVRRFILSRLFVLDVAFSVVITGLIMGGGFRMLRLMQLGNFQLHYVWLGFLATVVAFFLLAFVIAPLTFWAWLKTGQESESPMASRLIGWTMPLRLAYLALPLFALFVMVTKPSA